MNATPKRKPEPAAPQEAGKGAIAPQLGADGKALTPSQRLWGTADFSYLSEITTSSDDIMAALRGWD